MTRSAHDAGAIHTLSITSHSALGSRQARENAAPARHTAVRACATDFSPCGVSQLRGCVYLVCCFSVCADWQSVFSIFPHSGKYCNGASASCNVFFDVPSVRVRVSCIIYTCYTLLVQRQRAFRMCTWPKSVSEGGGDTSFEAVFPRESGDSNNKSGACSLYRYLDEYTTNFHRNLRASYLHRTFLSISTAKESFCF